MSWSQFGHVRDRFAIWRNPWADPSGDGFQIVQAIFAFAWGGVIGAGIGIGDPARIPAVETDFIFAAIGEELGLLGGAALLAAYVLIVGVGLRIARVSERPFEKLLATGLTTIVGVQAFIIIGGVTRLVPLTGVTLPFVSYGGSSLVANYVLIALLMRISDEHARRSGEVRPRQTRRDKKRAAKRRRGGGVNKQIRRLGMGLLACYVLLFVQLNVLQVLRADEYNAHPLNTRQVVRDFSRPRGLIQTADGVILAESIPSNDQFNFQRVYPTVELFAGVVGYFAFNFGSDGVERSYNNVLAGRTDSQRVIDWNSFFEDEVITADVTLSLRADAQRVAQQQLGDRPGAVVALDPRDGAILAMWSFPSYDPNLLATHNFEDAETVRQFLLAGTRRPARPRDLPRALLPRLDVQGRDRLRRTAERAGDRDRARVPGVDELHATADHPPDPELRRLGLWWRSLQHPAGLVQHRIRADGCGPRPGGHGR